MNRSLLLGNPLKETQSSVSESHVFITSHHLPTHQQDHQEEICRIHDQSPSPPQRTRVSSQDRLSRLHPIQFDSQTRLGRLRMHHPSRASRRRVCQERAGASVHQGDEHLLRERSGIQHDLGRRRHSRLQADPRAMRTYESHTKGEISKSDFRATSSTECDVQRRRQPQLWQDPQSRNTSQDQHRNQTGLDRRTRQERMDRREKEESVGTIQTTWKRSKEHCPHRRVEQGSRGQTGSSSHGGTQGVHVIGHDWEKYLSGIHQQRTAVRSHPPLGGRSSRWDDLRDISVEDLLSVSRRESQDSRSEVGDQSEGSGEAQGFMLLEGASQDRHDRRDSRMLQGCSRSMLANCV